MRAITSFLILVFFTYVRLVAQTSIVVYTSPLEQELLMYWDAHKAFKSDILETMLIAEGNTSAIVRKNPWLAHLEQQVLLRIGTSTNSEDKAEELYQFLQETVLRKYSSSANTLSLIDNGEFNCVTSSALFAHLATTINLPVMFHATPFHVAPIVEISNKKTWVELTDPVNGFDAERDQENTVEWLIANKYATEEELTEKGPDRVVNEFIGGHYRDSVKSLLGYHYYNQALALSESGKTEDAFWSLTKAMIFEPSDDLIKSAYDYSFLSVGPQTRSMAVYHRIVTAYIHARGLDTSSAQTILTNVAQCIQDLIPKDPDFSRADSVLCVVTSQAPHTHGSSEAVEVIRQLVSVNKAIDLSRKGDHRISFDIIASELSKEPQDARVQDIYAEIGMSYARSLLTSGKGTEAMNLLDSMRTVLPHYAKLREIFVATAIASVLMSGDNRENPSEAREMLLRAYEVDSTNSYLLQAIGSVYHELSMAQVRKSNWRAARGIILEGLRMVPDHSYLKSDLDLVSQEIQKSKKK